MALKQQRDADESPPVSHRQVSDPWGMAKDGKRYWGIKVAWKKLWRK